MPTKRDSKGRFVKDNKPMTDTTETTRNYIVPVPAFILWPVHVVAWLVATVVRAAALVALVCVLVAVYGWWTSTPDSCSVSPAPAAYEAAKEQIESIRESIKEI